MIRKTPTYIAVLFIALTLARVASFAQVRMQAGPLGWPFALGLGAGLFFIGYWTRDSVTRADGKEDKRSKNVQNWAWAALIFLVIVDMLFNLAEVWLAVKPVEGDWITGLGAVLYGAFPTLLAALLGILQGHIDRLPKPPTQESRNLTGAIAKYLTAIVMRWTASIDQPQPQAVKVEAKPEPPKAQAQPPAPKLTPGEMRIVKLAISNPNATQTELAKLADTSRQYVGQVLRKPEATAAIGHNGYHK